MAETIIHSKKIIDITNQQFGRLTVIKFVRLNHRRKAVWECKCSCGQSWEAIGNELRSGHTRSCGCLSRETLLRHITKHSQARTVEYSAYCTAKRRCSDPKDKGFKNYGGRGIEFLFNSFEEFIDHIGPKPSPELMLDRRNNDGNYEIGNIRWVTRSVQNKNRRPWSKRYDSNKSNH